MTTPTTPTTHAQPSVQDEDDESDRVFEHEADGTPSSEACEGLRECADCQDVLADNARTLDPGDHLNPRGFVLRVNADHTFHVIDPNDHHPDSAAFLDGMERAVTP